VGNDRVGCNLEKQEQVHERCGCLYFTVPLMLCYVMQPKTASHQWFHNVHLLHKYKRFASERPSTNCSFWCPANSVEAVNMHQNRFSYIGLHTKHHKEPKLGFKGLLSRASRETWKVEWWRQDDTTVAVISPLQHGTINATLINKSEYEDFVIFEVWH